MKILKAWTSQIFKNKYNLHAATCHIWAPTAYELLNEDILEEPGKFSTKWNQILQETVEICHKTSLAAASSVFPLSRQMLSLPFYLTLKLLPVLLQKPLPLSSVPLQPQLNSMQDPLHLRCARSVWPT